jgi:hypothetical protein
VGRVARINVRSNPAKRLDPGFHGNQERQCRPSPPDRRLVLVRRAERAGGHRLAAAGPDRRRPAQGRFYPGWIPERFNEAAACRFCFVHIDVDLYQPTRDSLEFFYPRMSPGGMIVCDDYGYVNCPGAKQACDELAADWPERWLHLPTGQGLLIKQTAGPNSPSGA